MDYGTLSLELFVSATFSVELVVKYEVISDDLKGLEQTTRTRMSRHD